MRPKHPIVRTCEVIKPCTASEGSRGGMRRESARASLGESEGAYGDDLPGLRNPSRQPSEDDDQGDELALERTGVSGCRARLEG